MAAVRTRTRGGTKGVCVGGGVGEGAGVWPAKEEGTIRGCVGWVGACGKGKGRKKMNKYLYNLWHS